MQLKSTSFGPFAASCRHEGGLTAVELLVTIAIVAILATLGAPSFIGIMERWRVRQAAEDLTSTIYFARSEAIKRGGNVVITKLPNGTNRCTTATGADNWDCGWFVCEDTNGNDACDSTEPVLQRVEAPAGLDITRSVSNANISLDRWGLVSGAWVGFSVVPHGKSTADAATRGVCMSAGGRVRVIPSEDVPCRSS